ncbi:hypothetical protein [Hydrogenophaga sp.]|uniref:hypothetical protein n=1 Tax=Hydrogenophaga sp. TaxID=1904254 RepID=UPI003D0C1267
MAAFTVALLGGESSGKKALATALQQALALLAPDVAVAIDDDAPLAKARRYDLTLLLAPNPSDPPAGEATDAQLRIDLLQAGVAFQVVHGQDAVRVQQALRTVGTLLGRPLVARDPALANGLRPWSCENCSDPECEHRLFTGLLSRD